MVDYLKASVRLLQRKRMIKTAMQALQSRIDFLEDELTACRVSSYDSIREEDARTSDMEDRRLAILARLDEVRSRFRALHEQMEQIERGYSVLTPYQRDVLDTFFATEERYCADKLCERYYKERSQIYRDRKKAIQRFSLAVFGCMETEDSLI